MRLAWRAMAGNTCIRAVPGRRAVRAGMLSAALALAAHGPAGAAELRDKVHNLLDHLKLKSHAVLVVDEDTGETLAARNADAVVPVASLTKLMTALVVLDADQDLDEILEITRADVDHEKRTPSRLKVGTRLSRGDLLLLSLMASENRASMALSRHYNGGRLAFLEDMNAKARALGMRQTWFADPAGLSARSVSTARDLRLLLAAANRQPLIQEYSTRSEHRVRVGRHQVSFVNSNRLVRRANWSIELQKTGFTNEAGRCLVMRTRIGERRLAMIFLNSVGTLTRYGDASRVRQGLEQVERRRQKQLATAAERV